uniref:Uncharacterized LOC104265702 n=2 Tax=Ciona intestinalis TaxID=7719 RepID=F7B1B2_CIOIN
MRKSCEPGEQEICRLCKRHRRSSQLWSNIVYTFLAQGVVTHLAFLFCYFCFAFVAEVTDACLQVNGKQAITDICSRWASSNSIFAKILLESQNLSKSHGLPVQVVIGLIAKDIMFIWTQNSEGRVGRRVSKKRTKRTVRKRWHNKLLKHLIRVLNNIKAVLYSRYFKNPFYLKSKYRTSKTGISGYGRNRQSKRTRLKSLSYVDNEYDASASETESLRTNTEFAPSSTTVQKYGRLYHHAIRPQSIELLDFPLTRTPPSSNQNYTATMLPPSGIEDTFDKTKRWLNDDSPIIVDDVPHEGASICQSSVKRGTIYSSMTKRPIRRRSRTDEITIEEARSRGITTQYLRPIRSR